MVIIFQGSSNATNNSDSSSNINAQYGNESYDLVWVFSLFIIHAPAFCFIYHTLCSDCNFCIFDTCPSEKCLCGTADLQNLCIFGQTSHVEQFNEKRISQYTYSHSKQTRYYAKEESWAVILLKTAKLLLDKFISAAANVGKIVAVSNIMQVTM